MTSTAACGPGSPGVRPAPPDPPRPPPAIVEAAPVDAAVPDAPELPRLTCDPDTAIAITPPPGPGWHCAKPDGTRHGPFVALFPDGSTEVAGAYRDGLLDGPWQRHAVTGEVVERGSYAAGQKHGRWRMTSRAGAVLGEYEMAAGTGTEMHWLDDGALYRERALRAGVPHGRERIYARDGSAVVSAQWKAGVLDGAHEVGTRTTLRIEETFAGGVRRGSRQIWLFGTQIADQSYDARGRLHGDYTLWRSRRVVRVQGRYERGKRDGLWSWNDRDGNKEREGNYLAGRRDGPWTEWLDGKIVFTGHYTRGRPDGEFIHYDAQQNEIGRFQIRGGTGTMRTFWPNRRIATRQQIRRGVADGVYQELTSRGQLVVEGRFRGDLRHGAWREWTAEGVPVLEQTWKQGKLDGVVKKYAGGVVASEATYQDGKAHGRYVAYRAGKPAVTGAFADDLRTGTWTHHSPEGRVTLTATYLNGELHGPWRQLTDGAVIEGTMTQGRRTGTWTRTERSGEVRQLTIPTP